MISVIERPTIDSGPVGVNWTKGQRLFFCLFRPVWGHSRRLTVGQPLPIHLISGHSQGTSARLKRATSGLMQCSIIRSDRRTVSAVLERETDGTYLQSARLSWREPKLCLKSLRKLKLCNRQRDSRPLDRDQRQPRANGIAPRHQRGARWRAGWLDQVLRQPQALGGEPIYPRRRRPAQLPPP